MKFFIGIVPSEEIYTAVADIQRRFGDNRLEPHITLRPPVTVIEEATWIKTIEEICSRFPPVTIKLPSTGFFGKRVLFIDVCSEELNELHYSIIKALQSFEQPEVKKQENQDYHPHLTLGRSWCGFTTQDFVKMRELADDLLSGKSISFIAHSVRIYHKPFGTGRFAAMKDVALSV